MTEHTQMTSDAKLRVLVVDDERAARQRLEDLLAREADVELVGTAGNGREAVEAITSLAPDLVFLDVQMPGMTGIEVVERIGPDRMPAVIFATAYDQYAVNAFDLAALDYLLKPFDDERFEQALVRARRAIFDRELDRLRSRLAVLLREVPDDGAPDSRRYLERIGVEMRGQMRIVPVERIDFITASGSYAELHVGSEKYLIREQMHTLEERLPPDRFFRIHRSTIVQLDRINVLLYNPGGDYALRLNDGRHLKVSRNRWKDLAAKLGVTTNGGES
ncbi:MAG TPA: LytTR family DNA-binding domain-containing protein [Rhodothermales bacterium]